MVTNDLGKINQGARQLLIIMAIIIVALGMRAAAGIINSIALALILSISMTPIMNWLIRRGLPRGIALLIVTVLVVLVVLLLVVVVIVSLQNLSGELPTYQNQIQGLQDDLVTALDGYGVDISDIKNSDTFSSDNNYQRWCLGGICGGWSLIVDVLHVASGHIYAYRST